MFSVHCGSFSASALLMTDTPARNRIRMGVYQSSKAASL
jgi:hypothetical protein